MTELPGLHYCRNALFSPINSSISLHDIERKYCRSGYFYRSRYAGRDWPRRSVMSTQIVAHDCADSILLWRSEYDFESVHGANHGAKLGCASDSRKASHVIVSRQRERNSIPTRSHCYGFFGRISECSALCRRDRTSSWSEAVHCARGLFAGVQNGWT